MTFVCTKYEIRSTTTGVPRFFLAFRQPDRSMKMYAYIYMHMYMYMYVRVYLGRLGFASAFSNDFLFLARAVKICHLHLPLRCHIQTCVWSEIYIRAM